MVKAEEPYWSGPEVLDWLSRAGIEGNAALDQLERAMKEGKLREIGRKGKWGDDLHVSYGEMENIPCQEALDLVLIPGPGNTLHLFFPGVEYPWYIDDGTIDVDNIKFLPASIVADGYQSPQIYWGWFNLYFNSAGIKTLWPCDGKLRKITSTGNADHRCQAWLEQLMRNGRPAKAKEKYQTEAIAKFGGLSARGFERAWRAAIENTDAVSWSRPGRKS
jgi:hypothetical protein